RRTENPSSGGFPCRLKVDELDAALRGARPLRRIVELEIVQPEPPGLGEIVGLEFEPRQIEDRIGVVGIDRDSLSQMAARSVDLALLAEQVGEVEPRLGKLGIALQRAPVFV